MLKYEKALAWNERYCLHARRWELHPIFFPTLYPSSKYGPVRTPHLADWVDARGAGLWGGLLCTVSMRVKIFLNTKTMAWILGWCSARLSMIPEDLYVRLVVIQYLKLSSSLSRLVKMHLENLFAPGYCLWFSCFGSASAAKPCLLAPKHRRFDGCKASSQFVRNVMPSLQEVFS